MEERMYRIDPQSVDLSALCLEGLVLDVGGGGEGIIAQCKREEIVVIDRKKEELLEAPVDGLKIVMDAKDMQFLDDTFDTVTSFFTMLYIPGEEDHRGVFEEIYRVLKDGGEFLLWDVVMPLRTTKRDIFVVPVKVRLKEKEVETKYGVLWTKTQDLDYFSRLAKETGFHIKESSEEGEVFFLRMTKR